MASDRDHINFGRRYYSLCLMSVISGPEESTDPLCAPGNEGGLVEMHQPCPTQGVCRPINFILFLN